MTAATKQWVYFGTYTHHNGESRAEGIYLYEFDPASGTLEFKRAEATLPNPSLLAATRDGRFLFAVNEVGDFEGHPGGAVSAYAIDPTNGALTFLNAQPSGGADPCYISLDYDGKWALVSNYSGGSISVYPIGADGRLGDAASFVQHTGSSGVNAGRQEAPHAHSIITDPYDRFVLAADLGKDQVVVYKFDRTTGQLTPNDPPAVNLAPGAGPRHMAFLTYGQFFYAVNELNLTITAFKYDADLGRLAEVQVVSALQNPGSGIEMAADLHVAQNGRYLYTSTRGYATGNDSISVFVVDQTNGHLERVEVVPSGGKTPRNFSFDLSENFLLVAHQDSSNVVTFRIDSRTGRLTPTGQVTEIPSPVCVRFVEHS
ncbi:MAG: lactonase family protein [Chloroflexota bacterium]